MQICACHPAATVGRCPPSAPTTSQHSASSPSHQRGVTTCYTAINSMQLVARCCLGGMLAVAMAWRGLRHGSLSPSGAAAAAAVGTLHMACGLQYGMLLIAFYLSSSKVTKLGQGLKQALEADFKQNGQRNAAQVLCNSFGGCVAAAAAAACEALAGSMGRGWQTVAQAAFLGHYACCCGDTWASEVGILSPHAPRLITSGTRVPPGTNGGVTLLGFGCSAVAGALMGLVFGVAQQVVGEQPLLLVDMGGRHVLGEWVLLGVGAGLLGSCLDSLLGATLQYSGVLPGTGQVVNQPRKGAVHVSGVDVLSNNAVNAAAAALTAAAAAGAVAAAAQPQVFVW